MSVRFVEVAAILRVLLRGELASMRFTPPDWWLIWFFLISLAILLLRTGSLDAYSVGLAVDGWLAYFSFRALISSPEDFTHFMRRVVFLLIPFAILMEVEAVTGRNLFALMGGVPETPVLREGRYRCQGSFRHAITAGSLGASFLPIFAGFLFQKFHRWWAALGVAACFVIVYASYSSGPLMAAVAAFAAWGCWLLRDRMTLVRRGIVAGVILLHFNMSRPVWFIFDRISGILGGDGWHRANIIDKWVKTFGDWWLVGMPMEQTADWAATVTTFGYADITNYYVSVAINGGLLSLVALLVFQTQVFKLVGKSLALVREASSDSATFEPILWGVGTAVLTHAVNLLAVLYWDQFYVIWYLHLAIAVSLARYWVATELPPKGLEAVEADDLHPNLKGYQPVRRSRNY